MGSVKKNSLAQSLQSDGINQTHSGHVLAVPCGYQDEPVGSHQVAFEYILVERIARLTRSR